ncbi:hypothetical protein DRN67_00205 [Candidatus Micrarchaeota archaeon]|nr:MAG: hypothetical protein DRN67_00205 [Candidatus Micrarchaeota archaeon]
MKLSKIPEMLGKYKDRLVHPGTLINAAGAALYTVPRRPAHSPTGVMSAQIEITLRCNLACPMCENRLIKDPKNDMTLEQFRRVIDGMPHLISINLTGIGESLLNKDVFRMIEYAKSRGIYVWFTTNGTLLVEKVNRRLIELGVDELVISFDAADPEVFKQIRLGATFEQVTGNLREFAELKRKMGKGKPKLSFGNTVVWDNLKEVPEIVEIAAGLGIDRVIVGANLVLLDMPDAVINPKTPKASVEEINAIFDRAKEVGRERGVEVVIADYVSKCEKPEMCDCEKPWTTCYITKDGSIFPCCEVTQRRIPRERMLKMAMGNAIETPFYKVWNSKQYRELRDGITRDLSKRYWFCNGCMRCRRK